MKFNLYESFTMLGDSRSNNIDDARFLETIEIPRGMLFMDWLVSEGYLSEKDLLKLQNNHPCGHNDWVEHVENVVTKEIYYFLTDV